MLTVKMDGIREVLSPLLFTSYVFGTRIIEFPAGEPRLWCSFLYMLLLWSIYYFLSWCTILHYIFETFYIYQICFLLNNLMALSSIVLGIYHDKKYRTCLKKLAIVDDTLEKMRTMTDYQKLYTKMLLAVFGWFVYIICITYIRSIWSRDQYSAAYSFYIHFMFEYSSYVNLLDDMIISSTLGYIELKFEQLNEYLRKLEENNEHALPLCQIGYTKSTNKTYVAWIAIQLHLELCKICRVLNSIFGFQMTIKMGIYFVFVAACFREIFNILLITNYDNRKILFMILYTIYLILNIFRLFIINYMCERVIVKANATGVVISKISYSTFDVVTRENISLFLLHLSLRPLKFYGLGLFQFGLKFFHGFASSVTTVIVILVQSYTSM